MAKNNKDETLYPLNLNPLERILYDQGVSTDRILADRRQRKELNPNRLRPVAPGRRSSTPGRSHQRADSPPSRKAVFNNTIDITLSVLARIAILNAAFDRAAAKGKTEIGIVKDQRKTKKQHPLKIGTLTRHFPSDLLPEERVYPLSIAAKMILSAHPEQVIYTTRIRAHICVNKKDSVISDLPKTTKYVYKITPLPPESSGPEPE